MKGGVPFQRLLAWLCSLLHTDGEGFDAACTLQSPVHELLLYRLAKQDPRDPQVAVAGMMVLLCLVYLRFGRDACRQQRAWSIAAMGENGRLSLSEFIQAIRQRLRPGTPAIRDIAHWLYTDYIIQQHQLVAESKLPENTFRFQQEGNGLRFYPLPNSVDFMDSRFDALRLTLSELGLCGDHSLPRHALTRDGRRLLEEGDLL